MIETIELNIEDLLRDYNRNEENKQLLQYYSSSSLWDILDKGRSETAHSAFIAWLFRKNGLLTSKQDSPLWGLMDLVFTRVDMQHPELYDDVKIKKLKEGVLTRSINFSSIQVETEKPVIDLANDEKKKEIISGAKNDALDIYFKITVQGVEDLKSFEIIIENKIGSPEGKPKSAEATGYAGMHQTQRYYYACNDDSNQHVRFFIFLKAMPSHELNDITAGNWPCTCDKFICINYQDFYDYIIDPIIKTSDIKNRDRFILNEYVRTLSMPVAFKELDKESSGELDKKSSGKIDHNKIILATTKKEQEQLSKYWRTNQSLLIAAIQAVENEPESSLAKHDWTRCTDLNNNLYTKREVIQRVFNSFKECSLHNVRRHSRRLYELFYKEYEFIPKSFPLSLSRLTEIELDNLINQISTKEKTTPTFTDYNEKIKFIQDVFEDFVSNIDSVIINEAIDTFNSQKYHVEKNDMSFEIINADGYVSDVSAQKLESVYKAIKEGSIDSIVGFNTTSKYKEIHWGDQYGAMLNSFWSVNKDLVMAAVRVLSENRSISEEIRKDITVVYSGLTKRDWSTYSVNYREESKSNIRKIGVAEWFIQTKVWDGKVGKPNIPEVNNVLKTVLGRDSIVVRDDSISGKKRTTYKVLHKKDGSDSDYMFYSQNWTMDGLFGKLKAYMESSPDYQIECDE